MRRALGAAVILVMSSAGCGDDGESASGAGGSGGGTTTTTAGSTGSGDPTTATGAGGGGGGGVERPPTSALAEGWEKAFSADPVALACDATTLDAGAPSLTFGGATIVVGFEQVGQNQNPIVARFDDGQLTWCERHEEEGPDGRALGLVWNGGPKAHVVYTIAGGGSRFDEIAQGGWLDRYGDGGGSSKVAFVGELAADSGNLVRGTFIIAEKEDGTTNTFSPTDAPIRRADALIELHGDSAFQPMNPDQTIMECTDDPFSAKYVFSADLTRLVCSESTNCVGTTPCVE